MSSEAPAEGRVHSSSSSVQRRVSVFDIVLIYQPALLDCACAVVTHTVMYMYYLNLEVEKIAVQEGKSG